MHLPGCVTYQLFGLSVMGAGMLSLEFWDRTLPTEATSWCLPKNGTLEDYQKTSLYYFVNSINLKFSNLIFSFFVSVETFNFFQAREFTLSQLSQNFKKRLISDVGVFMNAALCLKLFLD